MQAMVRRTITCACCNTLNAKETQSSNSMMVYADVSLYELLFTIGTTVYHRVTRLLHFQGLLSVGKFTREGGALKRKIVSKPL